MAGEGRLVDHAKLERFAAAVLEKTGLAGPDAARAAELIVAADLRGVDTHGVAHLGPFYVTRLKKGQINPRPSLKIESHAPATAVMDGDNGMGFLVGAAAMAEAMRRADEVGVGMVAVRNSTHFGAASLYALLAAARGMIGIALSSTGPIVVPPGSTARGVGTNPISVAVPAGDEGPFVLDMSTSVVPGGKISDALRRGQPIPAGWAVDKTGAPTTDPSAVFKGGGGLVPLGGGERPQHDQVVGSGLRLLEDLLGRVPGPHLQLGLRRPGQPLPALGQGPVQEIALLGVLQHAQDGGGLRGRPGNQAAMTQGGLPVLGAVGTQQNPHRVSPSHEQQE